MNKFLSLLNHFSHSLLIRKFTIDFFMLAIFFTIWQGAAISLFAVYADLSPSPHKYLDEFLGEKLSGLPSYWFFFCGLLKYLFLLFTFFSVIFILKNNKSLFNLIISKKNIYIFLIIFTPMIFYLFINSLFISTVNDFFKILVLFIAGIKSFVPFLAIFLGFLICQQDLKKIATLLDFCLVINLFISVIQQINYLFSCSEIICIRSTGLFVEPNTMAAFAIARMLLLFFEKPKTLFLIAVLVGLNIFLSGSRTLSVVFFVCLIFIMNLRSPKTIFLFVIGSILLLYSLFFGRGIQAISERFYFFKSLSLDNLLFGSGFGSGTQSHHLLNQYLYIPKTTLLPGDSQYLSFLHQGGIWLLLLLLLLMLASFKNFKNRSDFLFIYLVFWISGIGIIVMETWPLNIVTFMLLGFCIKKGIHINFLNVNRV